MNYVGFVDIKKDSTIPEGFDTYYWASKSCVFAIEECKKKGVEYKVLPWNWTDDNISKEIQYLIEEKDILLEYVSELLNQYHNEKFNKETWNISIGEWLFEYIEICHDKYINLERLNSIGEELYCDLYPNINCETPMDFSDFERLVFDDEFNLYLYSMIYWAFEERFNNIRVRNLLTYKIKNKVYPSKTIGYWKTGAYRRIVSLFKTIFRCYDVVTVHNTYLPQKFIISTMIRSRFSISNYIVDYNRTIRRKLGNKLDESFRGIAKDKQCSFEDFLKSRICSLLPTAQVENYSFLKESMKKLYRRAFEAKATFFSSEGLTHNELTKQYLMNMKDKNSLLCGIQHGGGYGVDLFPFMMGEYNSCDYYYTWGWNGGEKYKCTFIPISATKLMSDAYTAARNTGHDILYITYTHSKYIYNMVRRIVNYTNDVEEERVFVSRLHKKIGTNLRIRLFPGQEIWAIRENLVKDMPDLVMDPIKDICESLSEARMVVVSEWATTFSEALYMNKPAIVLRSNTLTEEFAESDLVRLHDVGIMAYNWEELYDFFEAACEDVDAWWSDKCRQEVVAMIKNKYVRMDNNPEEEWKQELHRYL